MRQKDLDLLEFDSFLKKFAKYTPNERTKREIYSLKPSTDKAKVERLRKETQEFIDIVNTEGYFPLSEYPEIEDALRLLSIEESILSATDILDIGKILSISREIKKFLNPHIKSTQYLQILYRRLFSSRDLEKIINDSIDTGGMIKDTASRDLANIRQNIKKLEDRVISILENILNSSKYQDIIQDKIITQRKERFVIPVKHNFSSKLRGIIHDRSSSGQTLFIEPEGTVNLNNKLTDLKLKEHLEIRRILKFLTEILRNKYSSITGTYNSIIHFDLLYTKAKFAKEFNAVFPEVSESVNLVNAKHPTFLLNQFPFKPIDIKINGQKRGLVITGPNTGGKTVALKTLGLLSMLNQTGIPVPVDEGSSLPIFDGIFADIGDMQSIEQNLSTYSAHIKNIKDILEKADENSLVLLDELIPGTDPDEGSAIGIGILEKLKEKKAYVLATSHFKQIKVFALSDDYFEVASVGFDKETLSPTYTIHYKSVGESMAFYIAEKLGLDKSVLENAKNYLDNSSLELDKAIQMLEEYKKAYENEHRELTKLRETLKKDKEKYEKLVKELEAKKKEKWQEELKKAEDYLKELQKEGYMIIEKIKRTASGKDLEQFLREKRENIDEILSKEEPQEEYEFDIGTRVKLKGKGTVGEIISIREDRAHVNFNGIKMWVKLKDLVPAKETVEKKPKTRFVIHRKRSMVKPEIKLIGKTKDEAIKELADYLDKAVMEGYSTIRIIHGYGSGILRKAVREYLDKSPYNIEYKDAPYHEGGMGVTVAHIK